ncbi:MAG: hypothetical protein JSV80_07490 [Acidobacteriota bacterium]|nr:MAG: hypothetical protein JSV80_07490 [Acidobacteriota bacterium]
MRLFDFFPSKISKDQARDAGMALTLLLLLIGSATGREGFHLLAIATLLVDMIAPAIYKPFATLWLGLSQLLGTFVSKLLLSVVFFTLVLPVGLVRRLLGRDSLQLGKFKRGSASVMSERGHVFGPADIERPY